MGIFGFFFSEETKAFKKYKKELIEKSQKWAIRMGTNLDVEIESIAKPFIHKMSDEVIASNVRAIPDHTKKIAEKLLGYPPAVGAYLALAAFGDFLYQNRLKRAPLGNLMLAFESMFTIDQRRADQAAELIALAVFMMDSRKIACDTYMNMIDSKMRWLVREKLLAVNREVGEIFLKEESKKIESLIEIIKDENLLWKIRQDAVQTLGEIGDPRAVEPIIDLIGKSGGIHSKVIINALCKIGDSRAVEPLILLLTNGLWYEQGYAAEALGEMGDPRAFIPVIETLRNNQDYFTRRKVIIALGKLGDKRASGPLNDVLNEILSDDNIYKDKINKSELEKQIKNALKNINNR